MGVFKLIFAIIRWAISIFILLAVVLFPIAVYGANPITFYWDKITLFFDLITSQGFFSKLFGLFK